MADPVSPGVAGVTSSGGSSYLDRSRDGRGNGGFYLLGMLVILLVWTVVGPLLGFGIEVALGGDPETALTEPGSGLSAPWQSLLVQLSPFVLVFATALLTVRWVLGRPARTVVTGRSRVSVRRMLAGGAVWIVLIAVASAVEALLYPGSYTFTFDPATFIPVAVVVLLLVPVQASTEEIIFRGYLTQWVSLGTDRREGGLRPWPRLLVLSAVNGLLFGLPHLANPEAQSAPVYALLAWFILGAGWAWVSVIDGRIELAIGAHVANNVFSIMIVANSVSAVATSSIWTSSRFQWSYLVVATAIAMVLFVLVTCRGRRPPAGTS